MKENIKHSNNNLPVEDLHINSIIIDGLNASDHTDPRVIKHLQKGGVTAVNATVVAWHNKKETLNRIEGVLNNIESNNSIAKIIRNTDDIYTCKAQKKVGYILGFQDSAPIEKDLGMLKEYFDLGVRIIQLTYNHTNFVGSGCMEPIDHGLTDFGKKVIMEMNRLGILIDLSHCGDVTTKQAIEYSELPVAFTHANPLSVCNIKRNKSKELFELLAKHGGVAGSVSVSAMLNCNKKTTIENYIEAIAKMVKLIGNDQVALGPDLMENLPAETIDEIFRDLPLEVKNAFLNSDPVIGFENATKFLYITNGLNDWGFNDNEVKKIMGLNWLNLYDRVWQKS